MVKARRWDSGGPDRRSLLIGAGALSLGALNACAPKGGEFSSDFSDAPVAQTRFGAVRGVINSGITAFLGVRYGAPTARFQPPVSPTPWKEPQDAFDFAPQAPQDLGKPTSLYRSWAKPLPSSEDCLFLNVWTPALDAKKRPVIVCLHGVGISTGSGAARVLDGTRLARRGDVVVVTLNHRLNLFGHLYLARLDPEFADSGNAGLLDIILALSWVRDNIGAFGGDADNVTLLGESAGAMKAASLLAAPKAKGLFHKAVLQSGIGLTRAITPEQATANAIQVLAQLGLTPGRASELKAIPKEELIAAIATGAARPVIDSRTLMRHPFDPDAPAQARQIPLLIGTTKNEQTLLTGRNDPSVFTLSWADLPGRLEKAPANAKGMIGAYRRLHPEATPSQVFFALMTDATYWRDTLLLAERKAAQQGAPVYNYQVDWETPVDDGKWGAPHAVELAFVMDNVARSQSMVGGSPEEQAAAQKMADQMSTAWIAFARTGNPNTPALPNWPRYEAATRATMVFNTVSTVVNDPRREERLMFTTAPVDRS